MSARIIFHGFNGTTGSYRDYGSMIEMFAAAAMPVGWEWGDAAAYDRDFIAEQDRYSLEEWNHSSEWDCCEVVTYDGEPIGVLDQAIDKDDLLANYATADEWELREARDEAAREHWEDVRAEERRNAAE